ncbi:protein of unknown function [Modestobacter italicus]|uniref:Uncharacterized protein n=1 Tax=Modestobacter italicus (strain DSM 44449 / CECT 9708 / BC 501) TaxID=2732864 RepID=I4ERZ5_MODI5|nr:protein of unknown function [Modestobacter marinus]
MRPQTLHELSTMPTFPADHVIFGRCMGVPEWAAQGQASLLVWTAITDAGDSPDGRPRCSPQHQQPPTDLRVRAPVRGGALLRNELTSDSSDRHRR